MTTAPYVMFLHSDDYDELRAPEPDIATGEPVAPISFPGALTTWGEIQFVAIPALDACFPLAPIAIEAPNAQEGR